VDLFVKASAGIVLTLRSLPTWNNLWHFPGGTVLYGETIEQTIQRVAKSEIGINVKVEKLLGYLEYPSERAQRGFGTTISLVFACVPEEGTMAPLNGEASEVKVFSEIPENSIEEHRAFLEAHTEWQR
jgi:ADP-ribose pyrophosphatase YjhB (NUDIX family)